MTLSFNSAALTDPVDAAAVREFSRANKQPMQASNVVGTIMLVIFGVVAAVFALAFTVLGFSMMGSIDGSGGFAPSSLVMAIVPTVVLAAIITGVVISWRRRRVRAYRLSHFARANGMQHLANIPAPPLPGMIFSIGSSRKVIDALRGERPRFVEFGNYQFTTGSGKSQQTHTWGFIAVKLNTPLPHIVLDAVGNNTFLGSNLPIPFRKDQRLSLEGDFDKHFNLYCPAGYERDALYLFTPDIMARFIDNAAQLDVEIVDDWLFLYTKRQVVTLNPATWGWLFSVVHALLGKIAQWERWRDDRLQAATAGAGATALPFADGVAGATTPPVLTPPPSGVASGGRRLRRGYVVWPTIFIIGVILFQVLRAVLEGIGSLPR